jgi:hypothetical protein
MSLFRINRNPSRRQLLVFGLAWLAFVGLLGWRAWSRGSRSAAELAWILAVAVPLAGLASPGFLRGVYVGLSYATYPIGFVVSRILLALVYYLALTPIGLIMRLFRHDPLSRRFDPTARSYWIRRDGAKPAESYFNQS